MQTSHAHDDKIIIPALRIMAGASAPDEAGRYFDAPEIDLGFYDRIVLCMSGGKDSIASLLRLVEMGVDLSKCEAWHHDVDGREGSSLMDWHFMADYNRKVAEAFGIPLYFSWLRGGFEGEMTKDNTVSQAHMVETPDGLMTLERDPKRCKPGTRLRFPQVSASLATRWCSSALKIDVGRRAMNNQPRFEGQRTLFITGERRQESSARSKYFQLERHHCDARGGRKGRHVDAWRPVLGFTEEQVWEILARHNVIAPVPYRLGWSRSSCQTCIYNSPRIWATIAQYFPERLSRIAGYEKQFNTTISRSRINVIDISTSVRPFEINDLEALEQAISPTYTLPVLQTAGTAWKMPVGAFGAEGCGAD